MQTIVEGGAIPACARGQIDKASSRALRARECLRIVGRCWSGFLLARPNFALAGVLARPQHRACMRQRVATVKAGVDPGTEHLLFQFFRTFENVSCVGDRTGLGKMKFLAWQEMIN
jgi:hypothetical protein